MPGTIQVSVLDFKGFDSSSQLSLKVSMGKREYQTQNKGDFSFPLTTLRDDLIITIQDAKGNEISQTVVGTRLVVEKGVIDETFSLEGGGNVHMKLQFVLNENERQRIRTMRETALKKKQSEFSRSNESSGTASVGPDATSSLHIVRGVSDKKERNSSAIVVSQVIDAPHQTKEKEIQLPRNKKPVLPPKIQEDVPIRSKKRGSLEKSHSNVKKMISAFETSLSQEKKPVTNPPPKIGSDSIEESLRINTKTMAEKIDLKRIFNSANAEATMKDKRKQYEDLAAVSKFEKAAFSVRLLDKDSESNQSWPYFLNKRRSSKTSFTKERRKSVQSKDIKQNEDASDKVKSPALWDGDRFPLENNGLWIFPDERKHLCVTSGGKKVMNLLGDIWTEADVNSYKPENAEEVATMVLSEEQNTEKVENSADSGDSRGPFGQVLRIVIMVGFGALVLLTRKRK